MKNDLRPFYQLVIVAIMLSIVSWLHGQSHGFHKATLLFTSGDGSYYCEPLNQHGTQQTIDPEASLHEMSSTTDE